MDAPEDETTTVRTMRLIREEWTAPLIAENTALQTALSRLLEAAFVRDQLAFKTANGVAMDMPPRAGAALRAARLTLRAAEGRK